MFEVVLYEPEIPQNAGNIIRLCANTGARLHLVRPLGFSLRSPRLRRAGLDYHELAAVTVHQGWEDCARQLAGRRLFALTTRGSARYDVPHYAPGDVFVFGSESRGLPDLVLEAVPEERRLRLPMEPGSRSVNLANAVAVMVYEAWRQNSFAGGK